MKKPVKKSHEKKRAVKESYEEPMRPVRPHVTEKKGKYEDQHKRKR